jgi:hypothetical protein
LVDLWQNLQVAKGATTGAYLWLKRPRGFLGLFYSRRQIMAAIDDLNAANAALATVPAQITAAIAASAGTGDEATLAPALVTLAQNVSAIQAALPTPPAS